MTPETITTIDEPAVQTQIENTCAHYWLIDPPNGPVSWGICKKCGEERDFENWESEPF